MLSPTPAFALLSLVPVGVAAAQEALVPFDVPQVQLGGYTTPFQKLCDFDADGDFDAVGVRVSVSSTGTAVSVEAQVYSNPGDGAYQEAWSDSGSAPSGTSTTGAPIAVGDLDGDGDGDFAVALGTELWSYYSNAPAPGFTKVVQVQAGVLRSLAVADFDGDGTDDVAVQIGTVVAVHLAAGGVAAVGSAMPLDGNDHLIVADTDGDPLPDVVLVSGWEMQPFSLQGGSLTAAPVLAFDGYRPMVDGGDVDGDGDTDLVAFHMAAGGTPAQVEIFRRGGPAQWTVEPTYDGGPAEYLADIDGDGDPDGVCCSGGGGGGTYPSLTFPSTFELSINDGGVFLESVKIPGIGSRSLAGAEDVDGDGDTDLVAGRCVYFNRGSWEGVPFSGFVGIETAEETADFDTDGDLDAWMETAWPSLIESAAWRAQGDGTHILQPMVMDPAPPGTFPVGPRIQGDFDGDGDADVILGLTDAPFFGTFLYEGLWRNSGGGSFHFSGPCAPPGVNFYVDSTAANQAYLVGDFEADGDLDLVMRDTPASWSSPYGSALVYVNDGTGYFEPGPTYTSEQAMAITDFDQDGLNDLIVAAPVAPGGVRLLRGLPKGAETLFDAGTPLSGFWTLGKSQTIDVADFNQDGYPDVAAANGLPRLAHVYLNGIPLGLGTTLVDTTVSADEIDQYDGDPRVLALDVNRDGLTDVVSGPFESSRSWRVYLQKMDAEPTLGTAAFEPGVGVVLSPWLRDDADGDGDVDVWGLFFAASVAIHGPDAGARHQYGAGSPGTGGVVPTLGATGPFRVGEDMELRLRGAQGPLAILVVSPASAFLPGFPFAGVTLLVDPFAPGVFQVPVPVSGGAAGPGEGGFTLPLVVQSSWAGLELHHQAFVVDAGAPNGLVSASNGMLLAYGP